MTIKLKQITTSGGETQLTYEYDDTDGLKTITLSKTLLDGDVRKVGDILGREAVEKDYTDLVVKTVNNLRAGQTPVKEAVDWVKLIDVDLEA